MHVVATSDLHGHLPAIPPCDLLILAGDLCPIRDHRIEYQCRWMCEVLGPWLDDVPAREVVAVLGNHDWIGEKAPQLIPKMRWHLLQDSSITIELYGDKPITIYGLPWQKRFYDWAFNLDTPELDEKYKQITPCDIIVSHGPPLGYGDRAARKEPPGYELTGNQAFVDKIDEIKPKLVVYGHIHSSPGVWTRNGSILANVTLLNDQYERAYPPRVFEI